MARVRGAQRRSRVRSRDHRERSRARQVTALSVTVPVPVTSVVRTVRYSYPLSIQRQRRVVRTTLRTLPVIYRMQRVRVIIPRHLPLVGASYVSVVNGRKTIHSRRQTIALLQQENNRRRYLEGKHKRRSARNGQLESFDRDRLGIVAEAARRGLSPEKIADAALVSRGLDG